MIPLRTTLSARASRRTMQSLAGSVLVMSAWAPATAAEPAVPAAVPEMSVVTVLGRMPVRRPQEVRRLDRSSASSCAYDFYSGRDAVLDSYLDSFYGKGRSEDGSWMGVEVEGDPASNNRGFSDTSPYGDASRNGPMVATTDADGRSNNPCTQSAYNEAGARNQIARKDKTLDQAYAAYDARDYALALSTFKVSYNKVGWDEAALMLGSMYQAGQGTARDPKAAIDWYIKVAEARRVPAHFSRFNPQDPEYANARIQSQLLLAQIYMAGVDAPRDPARARAWYRAAAELDHVPAMFTLARMLQSGYGGAKEPAKAAKLYAEAAKAGYLPAQYVMARLHQAGQLVPQDAQAAFDMFQQVAFNPKGGSRKVFAEFALAQAYDEGIGVKAEPTRALAFYKVAAVAGHAGAQNALATYFYKGEQVAKDLPLARKLFLASASQGVDTAMASAGAMLFHGEGGGKDPVQALAWLRLSAQLGNEQAATSAKIIEKRLTPEDLARADAVFKGAVK
ncbi:MAG: tetratricopeptide repeat protein [Pseudomonadota bacterium]